jgi:hypothetical protein
MLSHVDIIIYSNLLILKSTKHGFQLEILMKIVCVCYSFIGNNCQVMHFIRLIVKDRPLTEHSFPLCNCVSFLMMVEWNDETCLEKDGVQMLFRKGRCSVVIYKRMVFRCCLEKEGVQLSFIRGWCSDV